MSAKHHDATSRHRGRPPTGANLKLYERLMVATEQGLADSVHSELTAKEIAASAGTTEGMIQYYFGGKEQLTMAVLQRAVEDVSAGLRRLKAEILQLSGNPTLRLVRTIFELADPHSATTRLHTAELMRRKSAIKSVCGDPNYDVFLSVSEVIQVLVDGGVYSRKLDVRYATFVVMTLLEAPVLFAAAMSARGLDEKEFRTDSWFGFCAGMLDRYFRDPVNPATDVDHRD